MAAAKGAPAVNGKPASRVNLEEVFGQNTFSLAEMQARLPEAGVQGADPHARAGDRAGPAVADAVALAMKEWALEKGATHFTHWFQPLTGLDRREARLASSRRTAAAARSPSSAARSWSRASRTRRRSRRAACARRSRRAATPRGTRPRPAFLIESRGGATWRSRRRSRRGPATRSTQKIPLLRSIHALDEQARARAQAVRRRRPSACARRSGPSRSTS